MTPAALPLPSISCVSCKEILPLTFELQNQTVLCRSCGREHWLWIFPALHRPPLQPTQATPVLVDGEAACFFHPTKTAAVPCDQCGRFLCTLCDLDFGGKHYCPSCIDQKNGKIRTSELETSRATKDSAALFTALLPILAFPITFLTAPAALFLGIQALRSPGSLIPRKPWRAYVAIVLASIQICLWILFGISLFR